MVACSLTCWTPPIFLLACVLHQPIHQPAQAYLVCEMDTWGVCLKYLGAVVDAIDAMSKVACQQFLECYVHLWDEHGSRSEQVQNGTV